MKFDATYQGKVYAMNGGVIYAYRNGGFAGTSVSAYMDDITYQNGIRVALTGYSVTSQRGNVGYQTTSGGYIILSEGWQLVGTVPVNKYSQTQAQKLVDGIIKNNILIVQNNLVCARFANKFTEEQRQQIRELQRRCEERKAALQSQGLCSDVKTSHPQGYADLAAYLDAIMNGEAIGVVTWATVVVVALVIAAAATAAYYAYKILYDESKQDIKYSEELTKVLMSKLSEEEYQQLMDETQGIVTKTRLRQSVGVSLVWAKWLLFAFAGYSAYKMIKQYR